MPVIRRRRTDNVSAGKRDKQHQNAANRRPYADSVPSRRKPERGIISTAAGTGTFGSTGDGGPATSATLNTPADVKLDSAGNLYIADFGSNRVLKLDTTGALSTIAGSGTAGKLGDNGQAGVAQLNGPTDVALAKGR